MIKTKAHANGNIWSYSDLNKNGAGLVIKKYSTTNRTDVANIIIEMHEGSMSINGRIIIHHKYIESLINLLTMAKVDYDNLSSSKKSKRKRTSKVGLSKN